MKPHPTNVTQRRRIRMCLICGIRLIAVILQYHPNVPWLAQRRLQLLLTQWTICSILLQATTQKLRRALSIFNTVNLPSVLDDQWWNQETVVCMRLIWTGDFYIGSTQYDVFHREQTRIRKFAQLCEGTTAYFEPALKLWQRFGNFYQFCIFPIRSTTIMELQAVETACQQAFRPMYNWPWINPVLKRWKVGKQIYGPQTCAPQVQAGIKTLRRYRKRKSDAQRCVIDLRLSGLEKTYKLPYVLGSDTYMKFETSNLLRSHAADTEYIFMLWRLSKHMNEPFRTRARNQLSLILKFRHTEPPPANIPLRLQVVSEKMFRQLRQWFLGFTLHH